LWVTAIQVVMSTISILVNNVAQTTFLKRFGSDVLPMIFMLEALITFFCRICQPPDGTLPQDPACPCPAGR